MCKCSTRLVMRYPLSLAWRDLRRAHGRPRWKHRSACAASPASRSCWRETPCVMPRWPPIPTSIPFFPIPCRTGGCFRPRWRQQEWATPAPEIRSSPVSAATLAGHGADCNPLSPCAVNSPPLMTISPPSSAAISVRRTPAARISAAHALIPICARRLPSKIRLRQSRAEATVLFDRRRGRAMRGFCVAILFGVTLLQALPAMAQGEAPPKSFSEAVRQVTSRPAYRHSNFGSSSGRSTAASRSTR